MPLCFICLLTARRLAGIWNASSLHIYIYIYKAKGDIEDSKLYIIISPDSLCIPLSYRFGYDDGDGEFLVYTASIFAQRFAQRAKIGPSAQRFQSLRKDWKVSIFAQRFQSLRRRSNLCSTGPIFAQGIFPPFKFPYSPVRTTFHARTVRDTCKILRQPVSLWFLWSRGTFSTDWTHNRHWAQPFDRSLRLLTCNHFVLFQPVTSNQAVGLTLFFADSFLHLSNSPFPSTPKWRIIR